MKVKYKEYVKFHYTFMNGVVYKGQRYGQAFVNTFLEGEHDVLFYCSDQGKAFTLINENHLDFENYED